MNRLDRILCKNETFTLHVEISNDIIAKGSITEITKILTAMKCYGVRIDKFYILEQGDTTPVVNADFISARFILEEEYEECYE